MNSLNLAQYWEPRAAQIFVFHIYSHVYALWLQPGVIRCVSALALVLLGWTPRRRPQFRTRRPLGTAGLLSFPIPACRCCSTWRSSQQGMEGMPLIGEATFLLRVNSYYPASGILSYKGRKQCTQADCRT